MCRAAGRPWEEALSLAGAAFSAREGPAQWESHGGEAGGAVSGLAEVFVLGRAVRVVESGVAPYGLRGLTDLGHEVCPATVQAFLLETMGPTLGSVHDAFCELARQMGVVDLTIRRGILAYEVYERFMPSAGAGEACGVLNLDVVYTIADEYAALPKEMTPEDLELEGGGGGSEEPPWEWDPGETFRANCNPSF